LRAPTIVATAHSRPRLRSSFTLLTAVALGVAIRAANAESKKPEAVARSETPHARESRATPSAESSRYCVEIAGAASLARNARAEKELIELEQRLVKRTAELDAKRAELQAVIERHEAMVKKADERLVAIYARMRPDAAAAQFADMDEEVAAAMLMRLEPKKSSAILNEMEAPRAVALTRKVAGLTTLPQNGTKQ
jgi:flagellar motility protein MotE (MotC chaperone)